MNKTEKKRKLIQVKDHIEPGCFTLADFRDAFETASEKLGIPVEDLTFGIDDDDETFAEHFIVGSREQTEEEEEKEKQQIEEFRKKQEEATYKHYLELKKRFEKPSITETI